MTWIREGECCRCGECCVGDPFAGSPDDPTRSQLMRRPPPAPGYCPLFEWHGGKGHCAGHGADPFYLAGCSVWPDHPRITADKPGCSFTFRWTGPGEPDWMM